MSFRSLCPSPATWCAAFLGGCLIAQAGFAHGADARSRDRLSGMTALDSALGPLPREARADRPATVSPSAAPVERRTEVRPDPRGNDNRNADLRRDNLRREDLEADAKNMQSANRSAAIDGVLGRDPRLAPGAGARSEADALVNPGPVGGMLLNSAIGSDSGAGARSAAPALSSGSVIGGMQGSAAPAKSPWD